MHLSALRRFRRALFLATLLAVPSLAWAGNTIPPELQHLKIFGSGNSSVMQMKILKVNVKPRIGQASVFNNVTATKYTINAHTPVIPGTIAFMYSSYPGGLMLVLPWGPQPRVQMTGSDDLKTAPWTDVVLNATAGKSYLIDVNMWAMASAGSNGACTIDIEGPDGSDQKSSCAPDYNSQDIAFIYKATQTNIDDFKISILGSQASGMIFSATMAVLP